MTRTESWHNNNKKGKKPSHFLFFLVALEKCKKHFQKDHNGALSTVLLRCMCVRLHDNHSIPSCILHDITYNKFTKAEIFSLWIVVGTRSEGSWASESIPLRYCWSSRRVKLIINKVYRPNSPKTNTKLFFLPSSRKKGYWKFKSWYVYDVSCSSAKKAFKSTQYFYSWERDAENICDADTSLRERVCIYVGCKSCIAKHIHKPRSSPASERSGKKTYKRAASFVILRNHRRFSQFTITIVFSLEPRQKKKGTSFIAHKKHLSCNRLAKQGCVSTCCIIYLIFHSLTFALQQQQNIALWLQTKNSISISMVKNCICFLEK